ncbi:Uncharacterised protein [Vibrio cholerae]|nr:Uncharacterised protein [Vibrio cholerae]CSI71743.1 Uncharacterised protein [Vibrio cholerae]
MPNPNQIKVILGMAGNRVAVIVLKPGHSCLANVVPVGIRHHHSTIVLSDR